MAGIGHQVDLNLCARAGDVFAGRAHVIFHIAAAQNAPRVNILKAGKDLFGRAPGDVHNHVQAAAVAHAHDQIYRAALAGSVENLVHHGDESGDALERKSFVAKITLLQHLLEEIGANQLVENVLLIDRSLRAFHALLNPAPPLGVGNVHELGADGSAIDPPGFLERVHHRHAIQDAPHAAGNPADRDQPRGIPNGGKDRKRARGREFGSSRISTTAVSLAVLVRVAIYLLLE